MVVVHCLVSDSMVLCIIAFLMARLDEVYLSNFCRFSSLSIIQNKVQYSLQQINLVTQAIENVFMTISSIIMQYMNPLLVHVLWIFVHLKIAYCGSHAAHCIWWRSSNIVKPYNLLFTLMV